MGCVEVEKFFINKSDRGLFFSFYTIREISKGSNNAVQNVRLYVKHLVNAGILRPHILNNKSGVNRYQLSKEYWINNYTICTKEYLEMLKYSNTSNQTTPNQNNIYKKEVL